MPFVVKDSIELAKKAASVGRRVHLKDIRLFELHGKVLNPEAAESLQPIHELNTRLNVARTQETLVYRFEHDFTIKGSNDKDAVQIVLHLGALFDFVNEDEPEDSLDEDALHAFGRTTVQMAVHPYVRTAVSDITTRLGCPSATLDLLLMG